MGDDHVFRLCWSSSVNPPTAFCSSTGCNCLTNPTSLFTPLQPPQTLFTSTSPSPMLARRCSRVQCFLRRACSEGCIVLFRQGKVPASWTMDQHWYIEACEPTPLCAVSHQFLGPCQVGTLADCHPEFKYHVNMLEFPPNKQKAEEYYNRLHLWQNRGNTLNIKSKVRRFPGG